MAAHARLQRGSERRQLRLERLGVAKTIEEAIRAGRTRLDPVAVSLPVA